jgi:hypothetical protein
MREIRNEEKRMEREVNGKAKKSLFIATILLLCGGLVQATIVDVNIYSDAVIEDGDEYGTVNIYDTPPNQTTVTMTGGDISYVNIYDTASLNCNDGELHFLYLHDNATATILGIDYLSGLELHDSSELHIHEGSPASSISAQIFNNAQLHIYGYSLQLHIPTSGGTSGAVTGYWESGEGFTIGFRNAGEFDPLNQVFLHEIPEPSTLSMLGVLLLFIERRKKHKS